MGGRRRDAPSLLFLQFFFIERKIVFVHALKKKRQTLERGDIELALRRMAEVQDEEATIRARASEAPTPEPPAPEAPPLRKRKGRPG